MPCLTDSQISTIIGLVNLTYGFINQHVNIESGGSRFGELDAYFQNDLIGGLIPCGRVPIDQESIGIGRIRLQDLDLIKQILLSATPDIPEPPETTGDQCQDLINAINNINVSIDWTEINPYFQIGLNEFAPTLINQIDSSVRNQVSTLIDYNYNILVQTNNIYSELNNVSVAITEIQTELNSRTIEILERIHDTRVELNQASVRIIGIWDCLIEPASTVDEPVCKPLNVDIDQLSVSLLEGLSVFLNPFLSIDSSVKAHISNELSSLSETLLISIGTCCDSIIQEMNNKISILSSEINNPTWLFRVSNEIDSILNNNQYCFEEMSRLHTRLTTILNSINSLSTVTEEGDITNYTYHNNNEVNYFFDNDVMEAGSFDILAILTAIDAVKSVVEEISQCVCVEISGESVLADCDPEKSDKRFPYTGKGIRGISSQLSSNTTLLNDVGKRTCDSNNVAVVLPSDKYGELNCDRQIVIYFGLKYPYFSGGTWRITLPQPREDLSWADFEDFVWEKGKFTHSVRFSTDGGMTYPRKNATWGAFKTAEHGVEFFDRAIGLLEPSLKTLRSSASGRIQKRNPSAVIKCVRAIASSINNETGEIIKAKCYAPPPR